EQRAEAARQRDRAEALVYARQIALAQSEWENNKAQAAWTLLEGSRRDLRGWEHRYLHTLFNRGQRTLRGHTSGVYCVALSPDGKRIISGSGEFSNSKQPGQLKVWDMEKGTEIFSFERHISGVWCAAFSADGKRIVSGSGDPFNPATRGELKVWDAEKGTELLSLKGHTLPVTCVAMSADGKRIVSGGGNPFNPATPGELKVWDAERGTETRSLKGHTSWVACVA